MNKRAWEPNWKEIERFAKKLFEKEMDTIFESYHLQEISLEEARSRTLDLECLAELRLIEQLKQTQLTAPEESAIV